MVDAPQALPNHFDGMELDADDFAAEQRYFDAARTRSNHCLHTWGIAHGLDVEAMKDDEKRTVALTVDAGLAIDPTGQEIILEEPWTVTAPSPGDLPVNLFLSCETVPATPSDETGTLGYKRRERRPVLTFRGAGAGAEPGAVFLARVVLGADGESVAVDQEARRYCGFNLGFLELIDPRTGTTGATLAAHPSGGIGIETDSVIVTGSLAIADGLIIGVPPARARLDIAGLAEVLVSIRSQDGVPLLTVRQDGQSGIGTDSPSARLTISGDVALDGGRAIQFDGTGAIGTDRGTCSIRFDGPGPNGKPLALCADDIKLSSGAPRAPALTIRSDGQIWIGGTPATPKKPPKTGPDSVLVTVCGPVQSLSGGFKFGEKAVQPTAAIAAATVPIGTVLDWWPGPDGKLTLPAEFAYCEGQVIDDPDSPYHGNIPEHAPDLAERYVRGTTDQARIGNKDGAKQHRHKIEPQPHDHPFPHGHADPVGALAQSDSGAGVPGDVGGDTGSAVGHRHPIVDLGLDRWTEKTTEQTTPSASERETDWADNLPRSMPLVKIIRIK